MSEFRLSPAAERDLVAIARYTQREWGDLQAELYVDLLTGRFQGLADTPERAAACEQIRAGYRRYGIGRHVVYFRVRAHGIDIIRILHERM